MLRLRLGLRCRSAGDAEWRPLISAGDGEVGQPAGEEPHASRFSDSLLHRWRAGTTRLGAAPPSPGMSIRSMGDESFRFMRRLEFGVRGELLVGVLGESIISIARARPRLDCELPRTLR